MAPRSLGSSLFFPFGEFSGENITSGNLIKLTTRNNIPKSFVFNLKMKDSATIPNGIRQGNFEIIMDGNLLRLANTAAEFVYSDGVAAYDIPGTTPLNDKTRYGVQPRLVCQR